MSDISIRALPPVGMIALRGDLATLGKAVEQVTGCAAPGQRLSTQSDTCTTMWMSPDEILLICDYDAAPTLANRLEDALKDAFVTIVIVSDARQVFDLQGQGVETLLASLMPVDFAKLQGTELRRTRMAQIPAAIWKHADGYRLICFRSVARYAEDLLRNAASA